MIIAAASSLFLFAFILGWNARNAWHPAEHEPPTYQSALTHISQLQSDMQAVKDHLEIQVVKVDPHSKAIPVKQSVNRF